MKTDNVEPLELQISELNDTIIYIFVESDEIGRLKITYDVNEKIFESFSEEYVTSAIEKELDKLLNSKRMRNA